jgi:hypothetical protein
MLPDTSSTRILDLDSLGIWHPMTWRAISTRPNSQGSSAHKKANTPKETAEEIAAAKVEAERFKGVRELKKIANGKKHSAEQELEDMISADPKLAEFMQLMAGANTRPLFSST